MLRRTAFRHAQNSCAGALPIKPKDLEGLILRRHLGEFRFTSDLTIGDNTLLWNAERVRECGDSGNALSDNAVFLPELVSMSRNR
jgi:hypothetical protein